MAELLGYGKHTIAPLCSGFDRLGSTVSGHVTPAEERAIVRKALVDTRVPLEDVVTGGSRVAVVVSDHTRPTGSAVYMPILIRMLLELQSNVTIIIALGLHRPSSPEEIRTICGGSVPAGVRVINHDAEHDLFDTGQARFNREAATADLLIVTGAVTFHPMAGFSGGRKSLLPGIASADDIYANHRLFFDGNRAHSGVGPARVKGNPVLRDIVGRTAQLGEIWALNVVTNEQQEIEFAACGWVDAVWERCCDFVSHRHSVAITERYDTVVASAGGTPSDISFYQSMKVLTNASRACLPEGNLIIVSECTRGWDIREELFAYFTLSNEIIATRLQENFSMDGLALYMALMIIRSCNVWLLSALPADEVLSAGMQPLGDESELQALLDRFSRSGDPEYRAAVMINGSSILPVTVEEDA